MALHPLPQSVIRFIEKNLESIEMVEVLLLLHADPEKSWTVPMIDAKLRSHIQSIEIRVRKLVRLGFLVEEDEDKKLIDAQPQKERETSYTFSKDAQKISATEEFRSYYASHSARIIEMIYSTPRTIMDFSNAFKILPGDD